MSRADREDARRWYARLGDALSQLCNAPTKGGSADESISARCWREQSHPFWGRLRRVVEAIFWVRDRGRHCQEAYERDIERKERAVELHYARVGRQEFRARAER